MTEENKKVELEKKPAIKLKSYLETWPSTKCFSSREDDGSEQASIIGYIQEDGIPSSVIVQFGVPSFMRFTLGDQYRSQEDHTAAVEKKNKGLIITFGSEYTPGLSIQYSGLSADAPAAKYILHTHSCRRWRSLVKLDR